MDFFLSCLHIFTFYICQYKGVKLIFLYRYVRMKWTQLSEESQRNGQPLEFNETYKTSLVFASQRFLQDKSTTLSSLMNLPTLLNLNYIQS